MPRSWRLELNIDPKHAIRSGARISRQKALRIHFALVRQIRGLSEGHFSLLSIPANLFRSKGPLSVSFRDCELNPILTGETAIEKRLFNLALMQTTCRYLSGDENWPEIECPTTADAYCDSWSEQLWIEDSHLLRLAYFDFVLPLKAKEFSLVREVGL